MRRFLLFLFLLIGTGSLMAREIVDGYYLTLTNDTVRCKIEPRDLQVWHRVTIIDSTGKDITYKAKDRNGINGFGFVYQDRKYDFLAKADESNDYYFLMVMETGPRINLYYRFEYQSYGRGGSVRSEQYMLEDTAKNVVTVENGLLSGYKSKIKEFLNGDSVLLDLFAKHVSHITDLPDFVRIANSSAGQNGHI
jgi:hypothetical protein